jgi:hypothetical protein
MRRPPQTNEGAEAQAGREEVCPGSIELSHPATAGYPIEDAGQMKYHSPVLIA